MDLLQKLLHTAVHRYWLPTRIAVHVRALPVAPFTDALTTIELVTLRALIRVRLYHVLADLAYKLVNELIEGCIQYHIVFLWVQHFQGFFFSFNCSLSVLPRQP